MKASRRLRLCLLALIGIGLVSSVGAQATTGHVPAGLLLWNKLGSADEVTHSEVGPDLVLFNCADFSCGLDVPGTLGYPAGVSGGAAGITGGPYFPGARIHTAVLRQSILNPEHGAIEAWSAGKRPGAVRSQPAPDLRWCVQHHGNRRGQSVQLG